MKINKVSIRKSNHINGLMGYATVEFENDLSLGSISIFKNPSGGYSINYPTSDLLDPEDYWIFRPLSLKTHSIIENAITKELNDRYN